MENLRALATLAVVFLHINMTLVANYSAEEIGIYNYTVFNDCYVLVKWAVPCFIMITGSLLLDPNRNVDYRKILNYVKRMVLILLIFGSIYAAMELVFTERKISISVFYESIGRVLQGQSWSHMWYIYMLIGLYLVTIPLRYIIEKIQYKELEGLVAVMMVGLFLIPSINTLWNLSLENYMLISEYIAWYVIGYYLSITDRKFTRIAIPSLFLVGFISVLCESISIISYGERFGLNHQTKSVITLILGISVFNAIKNRGEFNNSTVNKLIGIICENSFAIYLIHPFF
ncbi:acyltransferase [uncultured Bacteroides sp.]|uniref:acyltransferase n=1 Tax=uncultured Bacteroides sp. TaxID=162156 RepID=UPI0026195EFA|nr:acyltransferase [uncultured Bacteroides sp.]